MQINKEGNSVEAFTSKAGIDGSPSKESPSIINQSISQDNAEVNDSTHSTQWVDIYDKARTIARFQSFGLQLPSEDSMRGSINRLAYEEENVNDLRKRKKFDRDIGSQTPESFYDQSFEKNPRRQTPIINQAYRKIILRSILVYAQTG